MSTCQNCQNEVDEGAKFCPACGTPVESAAQPGSSPSPEHGEHGGYGSAAPAFGAPAFGMPGDTYDSGAGSGSGSQPASDAAGFGSPAAPSQPSHQPPPVQQAQPAQPSFAPQQPAQPEVATQQYGQQFGHQGQQAQGQAQSQYGQVPPVPQPGQYSQQPQYGQQGQHPQQGQYGQPNQPGFGGQPGGQPGGQFGQQPQQPYNPAAPGQPGAPGNPAASGGMNVTVPASSWPIPDQRVAVGGRNVQLDLAIAAGLSAVAALVMVFSGFDLIKNIGMLFSGLFSSNGIEYGTSLGLAYAWLLLVIVVGGLAWAAVKLFSGSRHGRALLTGTTLVLLGMMTMGSPGGLMILSFILALLATALTYISPWIRRAFAETASSQKAPESVGMSRFFAPFVCGGLGIIGVLMIIGLRFGGDLGFKYYFGMVLMIAGGALGVIGWLNLSKGPNKQARLYLTLGAALVFFGAAFSPLSGSGYGSTNFFLPLVMAAVVAVPLWAFNDARAWFGDKPMITKAD